MTNNELRNPSRDFSGPNEAGAFLGNWEYGLLKLEEKSIVNKISANNNCNLPELQAELKLNFQKQLNLLNESNNPNCAEQVSAQIQYLESALANW